MLIAHLPAGYLFTRLIQRKMGNTSRSITCVGILASIIPDIDLLYFYFVNHRQTFQHYHSITHLPMAWLLAMASLWMAQHVLQKPRWRIFLGVITANVMLHMVMDSVLGSIYWLYPFDSLDANLLTFTFLRHWWVLNFLLHWTFMLEILITIIALHVWMTAPCKKIS